MTAEYAEYWMAGAVFAGTVLAMVALRFFFVPLVAQLAARWDIRWERDAPRVFLGPLLSLIAVAGTRMALLQLSSVEAYHAVIAQVAQVLTTLIAIWAVLGFINFVAVGRVKRLSAAGAQAKVQYVNALRKLINIAVLVLGALTVVGQLGFKITPLLTGLGIGGLAVALALQDTLGNLFAGFYMMLDQPLRVGDYIRLASGEEGFIEEIGWRNTKIRPWAENWIIVPNAVLSQTIITNHYLPTPEMLVYVQCGVSYYSDLDRVEQVTLEVAREVMDRLQTAVPDWEPMVRWQTFGDSNIEFQVILRVREFRHSYLLKSEFIKALHKRYNAEGIEISFPMRRVEMVQPPEPSGS